ncbi:MAG: insulinase family protein [Marinilabiliaceae bacterium]
MKRILSIIVLLSIVTGAMAQLDRSTPPDPAPAPEVKIGDYKKYTLSNGLTVIVVENHQVPMTTYNLTLDINQPKEEDAAGYIDIAGDMLRAGTSNRSKSEIDEAVDMIGATLATHSEGIYARSLSSNSEKLLEIMSDVLLNPTFPQEELEKKIKQNKTAIQANKEESSEIANNIAKTLVYGKDDPYGEIPSEETLDNVTREKCQDYYNTYFRPNEAYLVVVGDITPREAKKQAKKFFGDWEEGDVPRNLFPYPYSYDEPKVAIAKKEGANQSTVMVTHEVFLPPGHKNAIKARLMNHVLGGGSFNTRLFQNLREDKGYTYGAYSNLQNDERVGRFSARAEVRTSVTDSTITEMLNEMEALQEEPVDEEELQLTKNVISGSFGRSLEDPRTVARFALNIERYDLPKDYYETYLQKVEAVTADDIQEMADKYLKPDRAVVLAVGNVSKIEDKMKKFSPDQTVEQYDYYGDKVEKKEVAADVTPQKVIDAYIKALGGEQKLKEVEDLKMEMSMSVQEMSMQVVSYQKQPNKMYQETQMNDDVLSMQVFNGEEGKMRSPQGEQKLEGESLAQLKESAPIFPELTYGDETELELEGVETVDGKDAYKLIVTKPSGTSTTFFYGVDEGLKYKEVTQTPQGSMSTVYSDYEEVDGILFPMEMKQSMGPQSFDIEVESIEVNAGVSDDRFSIE